MKKITTFILLFFLGIAFLFLPSKTKASDSKIPQITSLQKNQVINKDYFAVGEIIEIYGTVNGDAYVAGGQTTIDGTINGDLLVAGGQIKITGKVLGNIRSVGGQIGIVGATIGKNITVIGGDIEIDNTTKITGSVVSAGGNLNILSNIGKGLSAAGGNISLGGTINNDVEIAGEVIRLTPTVKVLGKLDYWSKNDAVFSDGAMVKGTTYRHEVPTFLTPNRIDSLKNDIKTGSEEAGGGYKLFCFLSFLIIGLIISKLFPELSVRASQFISGSPWKSIFTGLLITIIAPFGFILLLVSIVGIPLAFISLFFYLVLIYTSKYFVMLTVGELVLNKLNQKHSIYYSFIVGLIIFFVLTSVPLLGGFIMLLFLLSGLGSLVLVMYETKKSIK